MRNPVFMLIIKSIICHFLIADQLELLNIYHIKKVGIHFSAKCGLQRNTADLHMVYLLIVNRIYVCNKQSKKA